MTINALNIIPCKSASCDVMGDYAYKKKMNKSWAEKKVGDIVQYDFNHNGTSDHTGILESINKDGSITVIEGNTSLKSNDNGGCVMRRNRTKSQVNYFIRPKYDKTVTAQMVLDTARAELGTKEKPANSNKVKYNTWFYGKAVSGKAYPWCMVFVCWVFAHVKSDNPTPTPKPKPQGNKCIDTSYWQGKHSVDDWKKVRATCSHAIHRASYTEQKKFSLNPDSTFATNVTNAHKAGLKCGAYHYSQAITVSEAKKEATYLCNILDRHKDCIDYYVVCDYEFGGRLNNKIGTKASDIANAFCDVVKLRGYKPCIYGNLTMMNNYLKNPKYPVWLAQYNSTCSYKKDKVLWQYTSSGHVDGISGKVDLSYIYEEKPKPKKAFAGEYPDFVKLSGNIIAKTAKDLAYTESYFDAHKSACTWNSKRTTHAKDSFMDAINKVFPNRAKSWSKQCQDGASCDVGASTVIRYSKADTDIPRGLEQQFPYMSKSKRFSDVGIKKSSQMRAGDIGMYMNKGRGSHIWICLGNGKIAEANHTSKYFFHVKTKSINDSASKKKYLCYRMIVPIRSYLKYGDDGSEVIKWQRFLAWAGFECGQVDGVFGTKTDNATRKFQKSVGLTGDGEVGTKTIAKAKGIKR